MTEKDIRDLMLAGEEKVSPEVWSNIRSRLDGAVVPPAASAWRRWGWSFALAAVAALAVILPMTLGKSAKEPSQLAAQVIEVDGGAGIQAAEDELNAQDELSVEDELLTGTALRAAVPAQTAVGNDRKSVAQNTSGKQEAAATAQEADNSQDVTGVSTQEAGDIPQQNDTQDAATQDGSRDNAEEISLRTDPFARMAWEDKRSSGSKVALTFNSSVAGNDSDFLGNPSTQYRQSSTSSAIKSGITETSTSVYGIPVSFGIGGRFSFNDRFSLGTGVSYSLLTRTFTGNYIQGATFITGTDIRHTMHYLGIPVNAYFSIIGSKAIDFHVFGGGSFEFCLSNRYAISQPSGDITVKDPVKGVQMSAAVGLGVSFHLNDFLSIYLDPSARYYFRSQHPKSLRTDKPFMVNLELGLSFDL